MNIILTQDVENLGYKDDLVKVKPGYARNYLIPKGMARVANESNLKVLEQVHKATARKEEKLLGRIQDIKDQLAKQVITIGAKVGTTDKIFGSVTTHHLAEAIKDQAEIDIDRRKIKIVDEEIKTLGTYKATLDLHKDHQVELTFEVVPE